ncbi:MAG TPA: hypothetical protein VGA53_01370, partial [Candidatus Paceibacterota bacterium]
GGTGMGVGVGVSLGSRVGLGSRSRSSSAVTYAVHAIASKDMTAMVKRPSVPNRSFFYIKAFLLSVSFL